MTTIKATLAALLLTFTLTGAPAEAGGPGTSSDVYHQMDGNDQAFGVNCSNGEGPFWVQKGQFAWNKCYFLADGSYPVSIYMPYNFYAKCSRYAAINPDWHFLVSGGSTVTIWGDEIYKCYTKKYPN